MKGMCSSKEVIPLEGTQRLTVEGSFITLFLPNLNNGNAWNAIVSISAAVEKEPWAIYDGFDLKHEGQGHFIVWKVKDTKTETTKKRSMLQNLLTFSEIFNLHFNPDLNQIARHRLILSV